MCTLTYIGIDGCIEVYGELYVHSYTWFAASFGTNAHGEMLMFPQDILSAIHIILWSVELCALRANFFHFFWTDCDETLHA